MAGNSLEGKLLTDYEGGVWMDAAMTARRPRIWPAARAGRAIPANLHAESLWTAGVAHILGRPSFWPPRQDLTRHVRNVRSFTTSDEGAASPRDRRGVQTTTPAQL